MVRITIVHRRTAPSIIITVKSLFLHTIVHTHTHTIRMLRANERKKNYLFIVNTLHLDSLMWCNNCRAHLTGWKWTNVCKWCLYELTDAKKIGIKTNVHTVMATIAFNWNQRNRTFFFRILCALCTVHIPYPINCTNDTVDRFSFLQAFHLSKVTDKQPGVRRKEILLLLLMFNVQVEYKKELVFLLLF